MFGRRRFIATFAAAPLAGRAALARAAQAGDPWAGDARESRTLDPALVLRFVRTAHLNLDRTRELLEAEPRLIRAAWEWSPGDFEMGVGGAAHSGSREIVEFLVERGAPYTVFAAAALGDLATVQAMVDAQPSVAHSTGAHGIPLIEHAIAGGEAAAPVAALLRDLGAEPREDVRDLPIAADYRAAVAGTYFLAARGQELEFRIYAEGQRLFIDAGRLGTNRLKYQGQDVFQLEGTPAQLIFEFEQAGGRAVGALLREGAPIGRAERIK